MPLRATRPTTRSPRVSRLTWATFLGWPCTSRPWATPSGELEVLGGGVATGRVGSQPHTHHHVALVHLAHEVDVGHAIDVGYDHVADHLEGRRHQLLDGRAVAAVADGQHRDVTKAIGKGGTAGASQGVDQARSGISARSTWLGRRVRATTRSWPPRSEGRRRTWIHDRRGRRPPRKSTVWWAARTVRSASDSGSTRLRAGSGSRWVHPEGAGLRQRLVETSRPAPPTCPERSARASACSSISPPRQVLTIRLPRGSGPAPARRSGRASPMSTERAG